MPKMGKQIEVGLVYWNFTR